MMSGRSAMLSLAAGALLFVSAARVLGTPDDDPPSPRQASVLARLHGFHVLQIELGELAARKGNDPRVRRLGDRVARDHLMADKRLMRLVASQRSSIGFSRSAFTGHPGEPMPPIPLVLELDGASGALFDHGFLAVESLLDAQVLEALLVATPRADNRDVQRTLSALEPIVNQHLQLAERLARDGERDGARATSEGK